MLANTVASSGAGGGDCLADLRAFRWLPGRPDPKHRASAERHLDPADFRSHAPRFTGENLDRNLDLVEALRAVADAKGATVAQAAIAWVLSQDEGSCRWWGPGPAWLAFAFYTAVVVYALTATVVIARDEKTSAAVPIVAFAAVLGSIILYRLLRRLRSSRFSSPPRWPRSRAGAAR